MTFEQTKEQFLLAYNSNAYLNMCESDDMHNAISALEKQTPKKPQIYNTFERHCECGAIVKSYCNYCYECGQALDWSDILVK